MEATLILNLRNDENYFLLLYSKLMYCTIVSLIRYCKMWIWTLVFCFFLLPLRNFEKANFLGSYVNRNFRSQAQMSTKKYYIPHLNL